MPFLELDNNMIGLVADDKPLGEPREGVVRMRLGSDGQIRTRVNGNEENTVGGGFLKYVAIMSAESRPVNPVVIVLENSIGEIVWTRTDVGSYIGAAELGTFPIDKTWLSQMIIDKLDEGILSISRPSTADIGISSMTPAPDYAAADGFGTIYLEIRVYQ